MSLQTRITALAQAIGADVKALLAGLAGKVDKVAGKGLSAEDYSSAEKTKLAGIATGATANATDAQLRDRSTHTGAQAISTVTGLQTALDAKAPLASPAFTGTPTAPTATAGVNTTQVATTAFVQSAVGGYLSKAVTGGTVTLTAAEASNPVIALTGTLTSALSLVVPAGTNRLWAIYNATSGAFAVTVKTASGTGVTVAQGKRNLVYTDGTNVYDGFNDFESVALTGTPTAPTAATATNTTQVATTAFVQAVNASDTGSAATAVALKTARTINGVSFNGTANITVADSTKLPLVGGTLTGALTLPSGGTSWILGTGGAGSAIRFPIATPAQWHAWLSQKTDAGNAFAIGVLGDTLSVSYAAKANIDAGNNSTTQVLSATSSGISVVGTLSATGGFSGNAATATKLATARTINGVSFDGTANITVADSTKLPTSGGNVSGNLRVTSGVLGYGTGAGGTVTQTTSKSTAVTLNKACGQITMHPAEMGTGAVGFTLNNSLLGDADGVIVSPTGPFTNYGVEVAYYPTATSVVLRVRNFDVARSDALIINFMLIKGSKT